MSEILLSNQPIGPQDLDRCGISIDHLTATGCKKPLSVIPNTPYLVAGGASDACILNLLSSVSVARGLTSLSLTLGSDNLLSLSQVRDNLQEAGVGFLSEAAGLSNQRGSAFVRSVRDYQKALLEYRKAVISRGPTKVAARQAAESAFKNMQQQFHVELSAVTAQVKARRGTPLTNAQRGINIAGSSRNIAKLQVANQVEAHTLVKLTRHAKVLGNGLAVIDFGARVGSIQDAYNTGGNWHRQMFIESSSFVAGAVSASLAVKAGLGLLMLATPVGWVGLVVAGVAIAGVAAGASVGMSSAVQNNAGGIYDSVIREMRHL